MATQIELFDSAAQRHQRLYDETIRFENCRIEMELHTLSPRAWTWPNDYRKTKTLVIIVKCLDQYFSCHVRVALPKNTVAPVACEPYPNTAELEKLAFSVHGSYILDYLKADNSLKLLCTGLGLVDANEYAVFHRGENVEIPYTASEMVLDIDSLQLKADQLSPSDYPFWKSSPEKEYKCEADKPIGERDVDKSLKEQQDKLWKKFLGI